MNTKLFFAIIAVIAAFGFSAASAQQTQVAAAQDQQVAVVSSAPAPKTGTEWKVLSAEEINKMFPGKTLRAVNERGQQYSIKFAPGGRASGESTASAGGFELIYDRGTWQVKEQTLCVQWERWQNGKQRCWAIEQNSDNTYRYATNQITFTLQ